MIDWLIDCTGSGSVVAIPVYVRHQLSWLPGGTAAKLDMTVGPKQTMGRTVEQVGRTGDNQRIAVNLN